MQIPGLAPQYTKHPLFPDMFTAMIVAALIAIGMNFAFALLRKKTTDIEKMNKVMKETNVWRKQYTDAIKKQDKVRVAELKKKQAYVNKMAMEMQQQQMRPMLIYMAPSFMVWIFVFPAIFGQTVALSPIEIPWIMCNEQNVKTDTQIDENGEPKGSCSISGEVYLWGWFLITSFAFSGIISKVTRTSMPSFG
ncbi:MAG TPA: EMC3/TMCO1 family protein [Nitrososphaeraceae archaeon]|nr:EMC3/TMCO1 family protein [Nitrososphaeraceae archaeon]